MKNNFSKIVIIFLSALILRLSLIFIAYHGDLNNNISWGTLAFQRGLSNYYEGKDWLYSAPNQPPLTILTFAAAKAIWQGIENFSWFLNNRVGIFPSGFIWFWESKGMILLVKLPAIFADLIIGWLIYKYLSSKKARLATILTIVWLFNPVIWYNSAIWGQTDSMVNLLGFAAILFLFKKDLIKSFAFLALSALFKGSLVIFMPLIFAYAVMQKYPLKKWLQAALGILAVSLLVSIWFFPYLDLPLWLFKLYQGRILSGEIGDLTANAFNFWWLVNPGKVLDSTIYLGLQARIWGIIIMVFSLGINIRWLKKKTTEQQLFFSLMFISLCSFIFMTRIHERYLYPFFIPTTLLLGSYQGLPMVYSILSLTNLLNLYNLFFAPSIKLTENLLKNPIFSIILSIVNLFVFGWLLESKKKY